MSAPLPVSAIAQWVIRSAFRFDLTWMDFYLLGFFKVRGEKKPRWLYLSDVCKVFTSLEGEKMKGGWGGGGGGGGGGGSIGPVEL